jgi:excisionase family DNA binding protein
MGYESSINGNASGAALVKVTEAARMLCVSPRTVWRMIAEGELTPVRFRRCTRVALVEVQKYLHGIGGMKGV